MNRHGIAFFYARLDSYVLPRRDGEVLEEAWQGVESRVMCPYMVIITRSPGAGRERPGFKQGVKWGFKRGVSGVK